MAVPFTSTCTPARDVGKTPFAGAADTGVAGPSPKPKMEINSPGATRPEICPAAAFAIPNIGEANGCAGMMVEIRPASPATWTVPLPSTATPCPTVPAGNSVEYKSEAPAAFNSARKSPAPVALNTDALIGKPAALTPASQTSPELSRLIEFA